MIICLLIKGINLWPVSWLCVTTLFNAIKINCTLNESSKGDESNTEQTTDDEHRASCCCDFPHINWSGKLILFYERPSLDIQTGFDKFSWGFSRLAWSASSALLTFVVWGLPPPPIPENVARSCRKEDLNVLASTKATLRRLNENIHLFHVVIPLSASSFPEGSCRCRGHWWELVNIQSIAKAIHVKLLNSSHLLLVK